MTALATNPADLAHDIPEEAVGELYESIGGRRGRESSIRYNDRWRMFGEAEVKTWAETLFGYANISSACVCYLDLAEQGGIVKKSGREMLLARVSGQYWRAGKRGEKFDDDWLTPIRTLCKDGKLIGRAESIARQKYDEGKREKAVIGVERRALARGGMMPKGSQEIIKALDEFSRLPGIARAWESGARAMEMTAKQMALLLSRLGYGTAFEATKMPDNLGMKQDDPLFLALQRLHVNLGRYRPPDMMPEGARKKAVPFDARVMGKAMTALGFSFVRRAGVRFYVISNLDYLRARKVFAKSNPIPRRKYQLRVGVLPALVDAALAAPAHLARSLIEHAEKAIRRTGIPMEWFLIKAREITHTHDPPEPYY